MKIKKFDADIAVKILGHLQENKDNIDTLLMIARHKGREYPYNSTAGKIDIEFVLGVIELNIKVLGETLNQIEVPYEVRKHLSDLLKKTLEKNLEGNENDK